VTFLTLVLGAIALVSGIHKKYPKHLHFIGHMGFANYFKITIFPIQSHYLPWTGDRLLAIALFAIPIRLVLHFGLMPVRTHWQYGWVSGTTFWLLREARGDRVPP
jgi:hypothetical protein